MAKRKTAENEIEVHLILDIDYCSLFGIFQPLAGPR
jgi:hypothetical protein